MPSPETAAREGEGLSPEARRIVALLGPLITALDATVVNLSLSTLARELHSSLGTIAWVASGYLLALPLPLPLRGWLVDRLGARNVYVLGFSAFTVASAFCGLAPSSGALVAFRVLQGMAGGLLAPMAQMMIAQAAGPRMARVMGLASVPVILGPILGPVLAGAILRRASWRRLFFIDLPLGALAVALALAFLGKDPGEVRRRSFDALGFALLSPSLVLLLYGLDHLRARLGLGLLALSTGLLGGFLGHARRKGTAAIVDVALFRNRPSAPRRRRSSSPT